MQGDFEEKKLEKKFGECLFYYKRPNNIENHMYKSN